MPAGSKSKEDRMTKSFVTLTAATLLFTACVMTAGPHGTSITIAPPLPVVVELADPYYAYGGFYYFYNNDRWYYSRSRSGPWIDLPRDRYPREVRGKGYGHDRGKGLKRGHDRD